VFSNRQSFPRALRASGHHRKARFQPCRKSHFPVSLFEFPSPAAAFLIRYQQLEFNVNHSKQSVELISNPQNPRYLETNFIAKYAGQFGHALHPRYPFFLFPFFAPSCYSESPENAPASKYLSPNQELRIASFIGQLSEEGAWLHLRHQRRLRTSSTESGSNPAPAK
jgi:hypothetical protein